MHRPHALIIVDLQNDFCEGGALGVDGGNSVAAAVGHWLLRHRARYSRVIATRDWHPHSLPGHFAASGDRPDFASTWPMHCVAGTAGAALHHALPIDLVDHVVNKGQHSAAYSGFEGRTVHGAALLELLRMGGVDAVDVCGIATSHCVRATVLDARTAGLKVRLLADLCVGVTPESAATAIEDMRAAGAEIAETTVDAR